MPETHQALNFAGFEISPETNQLFFEGKAISIESRQLKLLELLAQAYPEMVSKQQLMDTLWPDTVVSEASLSRLISDTRKLLGTLGAKRDLITTVHRRGFCLGAEVSMAEQLHDELPPPGTGHQASASDNGGVRLTNKCIWILSGIFLLLLGLVAYLLQEDEALEQESATDYVGTWHIILQLNAIESAQNSAGNPICGDRQLRYDVVINKRGDSYFLLQPQFTTELGPDLSMPITKQLEYPDAGGYVTTEITLSFLDFNRMTGHSTWEWSLTKDSQVLCKGDSLIDAVK